jgi:hypothetical protein
MHEEIGSFSNVGYRDGSYGCGPGRQCGQYDLRWQLIERQYVGQFEHSGSIEHAEYEQQQHFRQHERQLKGPQ